jgi:histone deacetylase 1/2
MLIWTSLKEPSLRPQQVSSGNPYNPSKAHTPQGPSDAPAVILAQSGSASVVTPPDSPSATATISAGDVDMTQDIDTEEARAREEGEAERDAENVNGEVRTEVAKDT